MSEPIPVIPKSYPPKNSALAICSLVFGIAGIIPCCPFVPAIIAIICGHIAYGRITRSAGTLAGQGLAKAGFILGYVGIAISIVLVPLAIPNFIRARDTAMKNVCVGNLRKIDAAKQAWALDKHKMANDVPTVSDIEPYLKEPMPKCPKDGHYELNANNQAPTCSVPGHDLD